MDNKNSGSGALGLADVLLVVFIVLKLLGVIDWSWWWVLSPLWISLIIVGLIFGGILIYAAYDEKKYTKQYGKRREFRKRWKF
jgi:hypothetical protein